MRVIYRRHFNDIWLSLHPNEQYSLKFKFLTFLAVSIEVKNSRRVGGPGNCNNTGIRPLNRLTHQANVSSVSYPPGRAGDAYNAHMHAHLLRWFFPLARLLSLFRDMPLNSDRFEEVHKGGAIEKEYSTRGALGCTVPPVCLVSTCFFFNQESLIYPL